MILKREKFNTSRGPVYRIDIVDTVDELGYISFTPPVVRVVERSACPKCGDNEEWVYSQETNQGKCPCGFSWFVGE
jgi:hypothetical protein